MPSKNGAQQAPRLSERASGILLHPTSLPGDYPIGDLGPAAYAFVDFLAAAGQRWWQMLPINPIGGGDSPYQSFSSFAGNPLLISPERLKDEGYLDASTLESARGGEAARVDYPLAREGSNRCLAVAFSNFESSPRRGDRQALEQFVHAHRSWLPDYALFMSLHKEYEGRAWWTWETGLRRRLPAAIANARRGLARQILYEEFCQWQFARQWAALKTYGSEKGIGLIGDIPIFVSANSSDVWAHPEQFTLRADGSPALVAGVPPDYFSKTGQLWGNPHYRWNVMRKDGYAWWTHRLKTVLHYFDAVRIDHFIGFIRYYAIPATAKTAETGSYRAGPGADFFHALSKKLGAKAMGSLIVEDLGTVTPAVRTLRDHFRFPGMKVLQFAFGSDPEARHYQPHNYAPNCVVYTGTHDNNTTRGWFEREAHGRGDEANFTLRYANSNGKEIHWDLIRLAEASPGNTVIVPAQDLLGLGPESRMNRPGTSEGNWQWRLKPRELSPPIASRLHALSEIYQRLP